MARKTVDVRDLVARLNTMNAMTLDTPEGLGQRQALNIVTEAVLHDSDNYKGYKFWSDQYLPACDQTRDNVMIEDHDDTKRVYFI